MNSRRMFFLQIAEPFGGDSYQKVKDILTDWNKQWLKGHQSLSGDLAQVHEHSSIKEGLNVPPELVWEPDRKPASLIYTGEVGANDDKAEIRVLHLAGTLSEAGFNVEFSVFETVINRV